MNQQVYIAITWDVQGEARTATVILGVYTTLPLAQQRLVAAIKEEMALGSDHAPYTQQQDAPDITFVDAAGCQHHYDIIQRQLDELE